MEQQSELPNDIKQILSEFEPLKGQFVIYGEKVCRLIGVATDEFDYYWVLYDGRKITWSSCLMTLIPLKNHITEKDYNMLVNMAKLNHVDQITYWAYKHSEDAAKFRDEHIKEITKCEGGDSKYLTELVWDIF